MSCQSESEGTFFQAKRLSHCLSSSSGFGAESLYVVSSKIIQMVSRGFTWREFAGRSSFAIKFPNPSDNMSACAPPFSLQGFPTFAGHISSYRCARNFEITFVTFLYCRIITHMLTAFSITFLTHLNNNNKKTAIHSLVCLLKSLVLTTCSLILFRLVQQFSNFYDWMARRP